MGTKIPRFFSPRVFTPRIEIERETERYAAARVHIVRGIHVHGNGIRLRDFEIRLKGNIPRFSSRISPRKRSLAFLLPLALCYGPCQKYGIKDRGVNQSDGTNIGSRREGETTVERGEGRR